MRKNVGTTDAMIRITGGLLGLAYGVGVMGRRPYRTPWLLMSLSAMKVAEGVTRFCPMYAAMGIDSKGNTNMMDKIKNAGMQTVMNQVLGGSAREEKSESPQATTDHSPASQPRGEMKLSTEDLRLEQAVREIVEMPSDDMPSASSSSTNERSYSESYSHDEHRYPTYS